MEIEELLKRIYVTPSGELQYTRQFLAYLRETPDEYSLFGYLRFLKIHYSLYEKINESNKFVSFNEFLDTLYPEK